MDTLPNEVKKVLNDYLSVFNLELPDLLESFYLIGSLVLNDYHAGKSDVDFVAVIKRDMNPRELSILGKIHKEINHKYSKTTLEGSYVTSRQLSNLNNMGPAVYFDGRQIRNDLNSGNVGIITWFILKNYSISVIGKSAGYYISNIDVDELIDYVNLNVNTYWVNWTEQASKTISIESIFILFEQGVEWGVLGISRLYYTMHKKDVVSKYDAGEYVLKNTPISFERIIKEALRIRKGLDKKSYYNSPFRRKKDTLLFLHHMLNQF
ncbi:aminoglycoside adenylyltransferase domain-containing protein [Methanobacterium alcaliphilum]|uniref:aminoglycoside adenylyltransferase domain-containing protein n=1 Tax=Methanobacterium alcaliphilum TaxID=392018 RepID=UPI00200B2B57|nr:aminoglycoside adenylyltransferase domain-containing protein [Methanobacterium alcaliphilum]MCK9152611.1 DUF4111 domain-containing protein [Methanobacterium alcaliphilum]